MHLRDEVSAIMRGVAAQVVTPRFRMLAAHEITEKSPGEIVTSADREAELRLHEALDRLGLGARIVGEEAVAQDRSLLDGIGSGLVWLIDPLDGTANFAAGKEPFGMMVALIEDGVPQAGWILAPRSGRLCHAQRGRGASCDGEAVRPSETGRTRPQVALGTQFLPAPHRSRVHAHAERFLGIVPIPRCAAESYPRLALGQDDIALFQRTLPWDHAAGILFLEEAGGHVTHWNGKPYRIGSSNIGILAAATESLWQIAADVLLSPETGLREVEDSIS
jgi:fructose-1,6-bisphosphatase/inositol monophosphatase family enzyme